MPRPFRPVRIRWDHPFAQGLLFAAYPCNGSFFDAVSGTYAEPTNDTNGSQEMWPLKNGGGSQTYSRAFTTSNTGHFRWPQGVTRLNRLSGIFSFFCDGSVHTNGAVGYIIEASESSVGETFSIRFDDGGGAFPSQGSNTFQLSYNNGNRITATDGCLGTNSEQYDHRIGMSFDGARGQTYANGTLLSDFASTLSLQGDTVSTNDRQVRMFGTFGTGTTASLNGRASLVLVWNRPMSLAQYRALWGNPDVLWDDGAVEVYGAAAAAGGLVANPLFGGGAAANPLWGYVA